MRKSIFLLIALVLCSAAYAQTGQVRIYHLHYDRGDIDISGSALVSGFAPDRKIQPAQGHTFQLINEKGIAVESFRFEVPLVEFTDRSTPEMNLEGGAIVLDETEFALVINHHADEDTVKILSPKGELLAADKVQELKSPGAKSRWQIWAVAGIAAAFAIWLLIKRLQN